MKKDSDLKWSDLKKSLQKSDEKELINIIRDLYRYSGDNRRYLLARRIDRADLPQMSSKKEHFLCYRFQVITSKSETIILILTPKNRSEKSSAESQSRKM